MQYFLMTSAFMIFAGVVAILDPRFVIQKDNDVTVGTEARRRVIVWCILAFCSLAVPLVWGPYDLFSAISTFEFSTALGLMMVLVGLFEIALSVLLLINAIKKIVGRPTPLSIWARRLGVAAIAVAVCFAPMYLLID